MGRRKGHGSRVSMLQALNRGSILRSHTARFIPMIAAELEDHMADTTSDCWHASKCSRRQW
jgi:hypothetical protein